MRQRLTTIAKLLRRAERSMDKAAMREAVQRFYADGIMPESEPARSFALLTQAFQRMTDASVGGGDYDRAREEYEAACRRWEKAERGIR